MKGALASLARRRAISVLPTPVGPIIRMFFGVTSWRSSAGSCMRRQRLRRAMATARLASSWPMMWRLSSWTISRGVMDMFVLRNRTRSDGAIQFLNSQILIGEDADAAGNVQRGLGDVLGGHLVSALAQQRHGRGLGEAAAGAHGDQVVLGLHHVAVAGDDQGCVLVGHG